jgi:hypothetical protein
MRHRKPLGFDHRRVERLLSKTKNCRTAASRIDVLSQSLLGQSYRSDSLVGSAHTAEVFKAWFDGFDCVTYIETILALSRASGVDTFARWLRTIRYKRGRVQWQRRNHYIALWIRNNLSNKIVQVVALPAIPILIRERVLNVIPGLAPQRVRLECTPKRSVPRLARYLQTGDLMFFVSTRKNLDVFHAGIIVRDGKRVLMRHASRSQGAVVEQELTCFLKTNRMTGVIVTRPQEPATRLSAGK